VVVAQTHPRVHPGPSPPPPTSLPDLAVLSPREIDVLRLVAAAMSNSEIAQSFVLETSTIKTHLSSILAKLDLRDRVQAVLLAYEAGWSAGATLQEIRTPAARSRAVESDPKPSKPTRSRA
jgi:DNA-binding NarL/FixJ family response regulator